MGHPTSDRRFGSNTPCTHEIEYRASVSVPDKHGVRWGHSLRARGGRGRRELPQAGPVEDHDGADQI